MDSFELFTRIFKALDLAEFGLTFKGVEAQENPIVPGVRIYKITFDSPSRMLQVFGTGLNLDLSIKNKETGEGILLSDFLLNNGLSEIAREKGLSIEDFYLRSRQILESNLKQEFSQVLAGKSWKDVPRNFRGYK